MLAGTCNFGNIRDSLIRNCIVCGTNSSAMRERLLREENLTLDKCMQLCRATELSKENSKALQGQNVEEIRALKMTQERAEAMRLTANFVAEVLELKKCSPHTGLVLTATLEFKALSLNLKAIWLLKKTKVKTICQKSRVQGSFCGKLTGSSCLCTGFPPMKTLVSFFSTAGYVAKSCLAPQDVTSKVSEYLAALHDMLDLTSLTLFQKKR